MNFNCCNVIGWEKGRKRTALPSLTVAKYTDGFEIPRWMYVPPNGDVAVRQSNSNFPLWKKGGTWITGASKSKSCKNSPDDITGHYFPYAMRKFYEQYGFIENYTNKIKNC